MTQVAFYNASIVTMTSREIAALTGKDLSHIHRDIRAMLDDLAGSDDPDLDHVREDKDARGYTSSFDLPKSLTITLMTGYSIKMRHIVVKRWQKLEENVMAKHPALPDFTDPYAAAMGWAEQYKLKQHALELAGTLKAKVDAQDEQIALAAPKLAALERIATANGSMCISNAAKALQMPSGELFKWMSAKNWIFRRPGGSGLVGYSDALKAGVLEHKITTIERSDGSRRITEQVLVTAKGITCLARRMEKSLDLHSVD